jgi:hypothetical protein
MKKLRLDFEELRVDTFDVAPDSLRGHGTVAGWMVRVVGGDTQKPDCDASGAQSCGYSFCGDDTCGTCDYNSYCGESCILVCDTVATAAGIADVR